MAYRVELRRKAQRQLDGLPANDHARISQVIEELALNARPPGVKKLSGGLGWRVRVGEYRVLYTIWDRESRILVDAVSRRNEHTYD